MKYATEQLPWHDFAVLGLNQQQVLSLPPSTLNALLSGNRTSLIRFEKVKIPGLDGDYPIDGKLSLKKDGNGELQLLIHPVHPELKNSFDLSKAERRYLESGIRSFIPKLITTDDGRVEEALVCLDTITNELVAVKRTGIQAPLAIKGIPLTPQQKKDFVDGKPVVVGNNQYHLDPTNESSIKQEASNTRLRNGKYRSTEMLMDTALLTAGLGHYVMLWHLASVLLHSKLVGYNPEISLQSRAFRNALSDAQKEIVQKQQEISRTGVDKKEKMPKTLSMDELVSIIEKKAGEYILADKLESTIKEPAETATVSVLQKKDDPENGISTEDEKPQFRSFKI